MKQKIANILVPIFILTGNFLSAQFNTLTPTLHRRSEVFIPAEKMAETKDRKGKKSWKEVFNLTSKIEHKDGIGLPEIVDKAV